MILTIGIIIGIIAALPVSLLFMVQPRREWRVVENERKLLEG